MLKRQNILDLLGGDSKKYQSCIITSYSFDVMFFEQAVLPKLSRAGITNINILVDASMLEQQLSSFSGKEYLDRRHGYSVTPIRMNAAFHPKLLLAVGKTKGFLAVGSGNLTGSGLSFNEEIWGTFFYKEGFDTSLAIFGQVKQYLNQFKESLRGVNLIKFEWLETYNPWYQNLNSTGDDFSTINGSKTFLFTSFGDNSFFQKVFLPLNEKPESIQILSPFYNKNGDFLDKLIKKLKPQSIHCIVNTEMGTLPLNYKNDLVQYTDWSSFSQDGKRHPNLHAKAIQITYSDKTYFILGSANATIEAFGDETNNTTNAEAILFLESYSSRDFFSELGIVFPAQGSLDIDQASSKVVDENNDDDEYLEFENYILQAEFSNNSIVIFFEKFKKDDYQLIIEDGDGQIISEIDLYLDDLTFEILNLKALTKEPFRCFLSKMDKRTSSYGYFHDVNLLLKTNPDQRLSRFNDLKNHAFFEELEMELFLDFLSTEDIFHNDRSSVMKSVPINDGINQEKQEQEKERVSSEIFNQHAKEVEQNSVYETHISTIIEDFLNALNFKVKIEADELSNNIEELELINNEDGGSENVSVSHRSLELSFSDGSRIRRKLQNILKGIEKFVEKSNSENLENLDLKPINSILIGFNLMLKYWNKEINRKSCSAYFEYTKIGELKKLESLFSLERQPSQINSGPKEVAYFADVYLIDDIRKYVSESEFITLNKLEESDLFIESSPYFNQYIFDIKEQNGASSFLIKGYIPVLNYVRKVELKTLELSDSWVQQKYKLLLLGVLVVGSCKWNTKAQMIKKIILLNTFNFLNIKTDRADLKFELFSKANALKNNSITEYIEEILELYDFYQRFMSQLKSDASVLKQSLNSNKTGLIIFSSTYGFAELKFIYSNKTINIFTPFGKFDEKTKVFGYSEEYIGSKAIFF